MTQRQPRRKHTSVSKTKR